MLSNPSAPFSGASSPALSADLIWEKIQKALNSDLIKGAAFVKPAEYLSKNPVAPAFSPEEFVKEKDAQLTTAFFRTKDTVFALVRMPDFDCDLGRHSTLFLTEVNSDNEIQRQIHAGLFLGRSYFVTGVSPEMALEVMDIAKEHGLLYAFSEEGRLEEHLQTIEKLRQDVAAAPDPADHNFQNNDM